MAYEYETRITGITVTPKGEPVFHDCAMSITIDDEASGEFVIVKDTHGHEIRIDAEEWPALSAAIGKLVSECRIEE
jgi:hypothetical protein